MVTSWSLGPTILSIILQTYLQLFFEKMIFKKSSPDGTNIYYHWSNSHLMTYKLRKRESEKLKTALALYNLEIHQKKAKPDYHRLTTMVKKS